MAELRIRDQLWLIVSRDVIIGAALRRLCVSLRLQSVGHDGTRRRRNVRAWSRHILNICHCVTILECLGLS